MDFLKTKTQCEFGAQGRSAGKEPWLKMVSKLKPKTADKVLKEINPNVMPMMDVPDPDGDASPATVKLGDKWVGQQIEVFKGYQDKEPFLRFFGTIKGFSARLDPANAEGEESQEDLIRIRFRIDVEEGEAIDKALNYGLAHAIRYGGAVYIRSRQAQQEV